MKSKKKRQKQSITKRILKAMNDIDLLKEDFSVYCENEMEKQYRIRVFYVECDDPEFQYINPTPNLDNEWMLITFIMLDYMNLQFSRHGYNIIRELRIAKESGTKFFMKLPIYEQNQKKNSNQDE